MEPLAARLNRDSYAPDARQGETTRGTGMNRNLIAVLALLLALVFPLPNGLETIAVGNRNATAAEPAPPQPGQQTPQVVPAQPGTGKSGPQVDRPRPTAGMGGMAGMRGQAAAAAEQTPQRSLQSGPGASQGYPQQPAASIGGMGPAGRQHGPGPDHAGGAVRLVPSGCLAGDDGIARHSGKVASRSQGIGKGVPSKRADAHQGAGTKNFSRLP